MFCSQCGAKIPDDSSFCYKCGCKVEIPTEETTETNSNKVKDVQVSEKKKTISKTEIQELETYTEKINTEPEFKEIKQSIDISEVPTYYSQFSTYDKEATFAEIADYKFWFVWRGRRNRQPAWFIGILLTIMGKICMSAISYAHLQNNIFLSIVIYLLILLICYLQVINTGKRLHDVDVPAWYAAAYFIVVNVVEIMMPTSPLGAFLMIPAFILTFIKGTEGENQYGPDKLKV